jgi:hypothetical protein
MAFIQLNSKLNSKSKDFGGLARKEKEDGNDTTTSSTMTPVIEQSTKSDDEGKNQDHS